jgi:hypothetical protein
MSGRLAGGDEPVEPALGRGKDCTWSSLVPEPGSTACRGHDNKGLKMKTLHTLTAAPAAVLGIGKAVWQTFQTLMEEWREVVDEKGTMPRWWR